MEKRNACRKYYKELRNAMSREEAAEKSKAICKRILACDEYAHAQTIYGYYPLGNEVNCLAVIKQALREGKQVALPKTSTGNRMDFYEITCLEDVEEGAFHIMEPNERCRRIGAPLEEGGESAGDGYANREPLVLVPGVVFDRDGNRYGYGKGFYDCYFARFPKLTRMGLAYSRQLSDKTLESLDTDVKMHVLVTENEIMKIKRCNCEGTK